MSKKKSKNDNSSRLVRHVHPMGLRVLVQVKEVDDISGGGLYLPETAKEKGLRSLLAEVLEVASAIDDETHEETNISGIPFGALVLIEKEAGIPVPWDETLRLVETKDVLAIVDEEELN